MREVALVLSMWLVSTIAAIAWINWPEQATTPELHGTSNRYSPWHEPPVRWLQPGF